MKNRRIAVVAFLMAVVLCLGVGFAALQDELTASGTLSYSKEEAAKNFNELVYFGVAAVDTEASNCANPAATFEVVDVDTENVKDNLVITVANDVFGAVGQTLVINATVKNDSTDSATVAAVSATEFASAFTVESQSASIPAGESGVVVITITLTSSANDLTNEAFSIELIVTSEH